MVVITNKYSIKKECSFCRLLWTSPIFSRFQMLITLIILLDDKKSYSCLTLTFFSKFLNFALFGPSALSSLCRAVAEDFERTKTFLELKLGQNIIKPSKKKNAQEISMGKRPFLPLIQNGNLYYWEKNQPNQTDTYYTWLDS